MIFFFNHIKFNCSQNIPLKHKFIPVHKYLDAGLYIIDRPKSINLQFTVHTHISPCLNFCKSKLIKQTLHYALLITRIVKILINNTTHSYTSGQQRSIRLQLMLCYSLLLLIHLLPYRSFVPEILFHTITHSSIVFFFLNVFQTLFFDIFLFQTRFYPFIFTLSFFFLKNSRKEKIKVQSTPNLFSSPVSFFLPHFPTIIPPYPYPYLFIVERDFNTIQISLRSLFRFDSFRMHVCEKFFAGIKRFEPAERGIEDEGRGEGGRKNG